MRVRWQRVKPDPRDLRQGDCAAKIRQVAARR